MYKHFSNQHLIIKNFRSSHKNNIVKIQFKEYIFPLFVGNCLLKKNILLDPMSLNNVFFSLVCQRIC